MPSSFISEPIKPARATFDAGRMALGEPGVPQEFTWRNRTFKVKKIRRRWRKLGPCTHGSREMYVRKHFYDIETEDGEVMTVYFDRNPIKGRAGRPRWWLFSKE
jgi:phosphoribosylglycinamide formyltransferase-1